MCAMQNPVSTILSDGVFNCISSYFLGAILAGDESYRLYSSGKRVWLAVIKHNSGYCTAEQLDEHMQALSNIASTTKGRVYSKSELTSRNWFTPNKQGFAIGFESDSAVTSDSICDYAEECIPKLSSEEKLCIIRGAFDGRSSIDINKSTNDLRYIVLDCGNDRAMDILAKLLREIGVKYNCNYARERLEGGEPRKPQLRIAAASGATFAQRIGYISPARLAILQTALGNRYFQREAGEILCGLKLLVRNGFSIGERFGQTVPPKPNPPSELTRVRDSRPIAAVEIPSVSLGDSVLHRTFGVGKVIRIEDNNYLEIDFSGIIKKFQHPQAFTSGFLKKAD